ncbi:hypothetical protein EVAR_94070_1 [Eumeta japonica]|uniref:Uncharacterized protein n=1 Tax=Eumeta variegata TaxID=151549 RepID=A0A4C1V702_EUMVA|nr:hypothetical protein EVAR_94070_1 [Eumeta japonica]
MVHVIETECTRDLREKNNQQTLSRWRPNGVSENTRSLVGGPRTKISQQFAVLMRAECLSGARSSADRKLYVIPENAAR